MKVLHFYKTSYPDSMGGVEQVIHQIARGASKYGVETNVLSLTAERLAPRIAIDGYHVNRARLDMQISSTGFSASAFHRFSILAKQADVIQYHFPWPFMDVVHFVTRVRKPTLVTYHSDIIRQKNLLRLYKPLQRVFLKSVDRIVATSPNYLATSTVLQHFAANVTVIPIGIDRTMYPRPSTEKTRLWREALPAKFFLFVGVLRYYKGLHILIEAARGSNFPIVIVGAGPIELELKAQVRQLGLRNVFFLGQLSEEDKMALLELCYAVVFPSHLRSEAFGVSLLEGAMAGKPLISSEIGTGTSFINIGDETGFVVPPGDANALRHAMQVLWNDPSKAIEMGKRAGERYQANFTADKMVKSYIEVYKDLIS